MPTPASPTSVGLEFEIGTGALPGSPSLTKIASLPNGGFVAAWNAWSGNFLETEQLQIFGPGGEKIGAGLLIDSIDLTEADPFFSFNYILAPSVAAFGNDNIVVVWTDANDNSGDIHGEILDRNGALIESEFLINSDVGGIQFQPQTVALANGGFVVSWLDASKQNMGYARIYGNNGAPQGTEFQIGFGATIAPLDGGGFVAISAVANNIIGRIFQDDGTSADAPFPVDNASFAGSGVKVTQLDGGDFLVVYWNRYYLGGPGVIKGQVFDVSGNKVGSGFVLKADQTTSDVYDNPVASPLPDGGFILAWNVDNGNGNLTHILGQQFDASGLAVGSQIVKEKTGSVGYVHVSDVSTLSDGNFLVAYGQTHLDRGDLVVDGTFGQLFSPLPTANPQPQIAFLAELAQASYHLNLNTEVPSLNRSGTELADKLFTHLATADQAYRSLLPYEQASSQLFHFITPTGDFFSNLSPVNTGDLYFPKNGLDHGIYVNKNAAALIGQKGDSLFIAFRGTNDGDPTPITIAQGVTDSSSPDINDYTPMEEHYDKLKPLLDDITAYVNAGGVNHVYVTGHSLGAAMVQQFMAEHAHDPRYQAVTFADPGFVVPLVKNTSLSIQEPPSGDDIRITNVIIDGDPITAVKQWPAKLAETIFLFKIGEAGSISMIAHPPDETPDALHSLHDMALYYQAAIAISSQENVSALADFWFDKPYEFEIDAPDDPTHELSFSVISYAWSSGTNGVTARLNDIDWSTLLAGDVFGLPIKGLVGSRFGDHLTGGTLDDVLMGGSGDDTLDGGEGDNTAIYGGPLINFSSGTGIQTHTWWQNPDGSWTVKDISGLSHLNGPDGTDTLRNIQWLDFDDKKHISINTPHGRFLDGIVSGATVFGDTNGNGHFDPSESSTTTDPNGNFILVGGAGPLIAFGGVDTSTGLQFKGQLSAPSGSTVITPLTTLMALLVTDALAEQKVLSSFGLSSSLDLNTFDPIAAAQAGSADGGLVEVAHAKVYDTVSLIASTLVAAGGEFSSGVKFAFAAIASAIGGSGVSLTNGAHVVALVTAAAQADGLTLGQDVADSVAAIIVASNTLLDQQAQSGATGDELLNAIAAIERVIQGTASNAIQQGSNDPAQVQALAEAFSGENLDETVSTALEHLGTADMTAPTLTALSDQTNEATSAAGATALFTATALDNVDGTVPVVFKEGNTVVHSGDVFGLGSHTITASTIDAAGNTNSASFTINVVDTSAPTLTTVANQTREATSAAGAAAFFAATSTDRVDGAPPVVFKEGNTVVHSGDVFSLGNHTITASTTDAAGNLASETFTINVRDTTAPTITPIADQALQATTAAGAAAVFSATATDLVDGTDPVVFKEGAKVVHSGDIFGVGIHTITAGTADVAGNTAFETFTLKVVAPNHTPIAVADSNGVAKGKAVSVSASKGVLANDSDADHDHLSVGSVNGSTANVGHAIKGDYGTLTLNADGSYSYVATAKALPSKIFAQDTFSYTNVDGHGGSDTSTLTFSVYDPSFNYQAGSNTILWGGSGKNVLDGSGGHDLLYGSNGADVLIGGDGNILAGGKGTDQFVFRPEFGANTILDFDVNNDHLQFDTSTFNSIKSFLDHTTNTALGALISDGHGDSVLLVGVNKSQLLAHSSDLLIS